MLTLEVAPDHMILLFYRNKQLAQNVRASEHTSSEHSQVPALQLFAGFAKVVQHGACWGCCTIHSQPHRRDGVGLSLWEASKIFEALTADKAIRPKEKTLRAIEEL